jgi:hypothetical protein
MKVLYMSGYANLAIDVETLSPNTSFLQKPFTPSVLAGKVRECLSLAAVQSPRPVSRLTA